MTGHWTLLNFLHIITGCCTDTRSREGFVRVHQECPSAGLVLLCSLPNCAVRAHVAQVQPLATAVRKVVSGKDRLTHRFL